MTWDYGLPERNPRMLPAFVDALPAAAGSKLAIFDADGTLWCDDVADDFATWMRVENGMSSDAQWAEYLSIYREDHAAGCRFMLQQYAGLTYEHVCDRVFHWWRKVAERRWVGEALEALLTMVDRGYVVWVVTGSPTVTMLPLKEMLGVQEVLGMDFDLDEAGVITGRLSGLSCADEGKADKVLSLWPDRDNIALAAGNGSLDAAMMRLAREVIWAVYPNPAFEAQARSEGWHILPRPADFVEEAKLA
jgi:HAD superfamily phosphoserine phosphatase-like hydrolase